MNGSADPRYRYTMPALAVKHEGSSKMKKSVIVNLNEVSRAVGRPAEYLLTHLGQSLNAANKIEKDKAYIAGHHDAKLLQQHVLVFIKEFVMCKHCNNPETSCGLEGNKKNKILFLLCKSCGKRTDLDSSKRFVKYMAQHPPSDSVQGHAQAACSTSPSVIASIAELADAEQAEEGEEQKKKRHTCPNCGHRTSKAVCKRCNTNMAKEDDGIDDFDGKGCHHCVQQWIQGHESGSTSAELLLDFDATIKSCDFHTSPAKQLAAFIEIVARDAMAKCELNMSKLQPVMVSEKVGSWVKKWSPLIDALYSKTGDKQRSMDIMISSLFKAAADIPDDTKEPIVIGFLLSFQDLLEVMDEDILAGCRRLPARSKAMEKFIEFLESNDQESGAE